MSKVRQDWNRHADLEQARRMRQADEDTKRQSVARLYRLGLSLDAIGKRIGMDPRRARSILVDRGLIDTHSNHNGAT